MVGGRSWEDDARFGRINLTSGAGGGGGRPGRRSRRSRWWRPPGARGPARGGVRGPGPAGGGTPGPRAGLAGDQLRGPRLREGDPADGHCPVHQHRLCWAAARLGGGDADRGARAVVEAVARMGVGSALRAVSSAVLAPARRPPWRWPARTPPWPPGAAGGAVRVTRITGPDGRVLYQARPVADEAVKPAVAAIATDVLRGGRPRHRGPGPDRPAPPPARPAPPRTMPTPGSWASP